MRGFMNEIHTTASVAVNSGTVFSQSISPSTGTSADGKRVAEYPVTDPDKTNKLAIRVSNKPLIPRNDHPRGTELPVISARKIAGAVKINDIVNMVDGVANTGLRSVADVVNQDGARAGFDLYNGGNYLSDTISGISGYMVICAFIYHKISRLEWRSAALYGYHEVTHCWQNRELRAQKCTVADLRDYALVARLYSDHTPDPLQQILAELDGDLVRDGKISALVSNLLTFFTNAHRCETQSIPSEWVVGSLADELRVWQDRFEQSSKAVASEKGTRQLKTGLPSKRLIREFNAIVRPMGIAIKRRALPLRIMYRRSSLATDHWLVVNEKKLHRFLASCSQLPPLSAIKEKVLRCSDDAQVLKLFSGYERRRIKHQQIQWIATAVAAVSAFLPLGKIDYAVRSVRQFREAAYREKNLQILDEKLVRIATFFDECEARLSGPDAGVLRSILEEACLVIQAKKDRTRIKKVHATTQGGLDVAAAIVGSAASVLVPGFGGLASDVGFGAVKLVAATSTIGIRTRTDRKNQQQGRIESKVYMALKTAHNKARSKEEKREMVILARSLFDLTEEQVVLLFQRSDTNDLVTAKKLIRLRFNNTPIDMPLKLLLQKVDSPRLPDPHPGRLSDNRLPCAATAPASSCIHTVVRL